MKGLWWLGGLTLLIIVAAVAVVLIPVPAKTPTDGGTATSTTPASLDDLISVNSPLPGAAVSSPLTISGQARGTWYFEASFPATLLDASGAVIAQAPAQAQSDWMTTDYVPFTLSLTFHTQASGSHGILVLKNDNPSGDPAHSKTLSIPVEFR